RTRDDQCQAGRCVGSPVPTVACTTDTGCDDGNPCNGSETCRDGACISGTPVECIGRVPCALMSGLEVTSCPDPLPGALGQHMPRARELLGEAAAAARAGKLREARKRLRQASASLPSAKAIKRARKKGSILSDCAEALTGTHRRVKMLREGLSRCAG